MGCIFHARESLLTSAIVYEAAVRKEISDETDRETGQTKQISSVPIHLSIYSPSGMSNVISIFSKYSCNDRCEIYARHAIFSLVSCSHHEIRTIIYQF